MRIGFCGPFCDTNFGDYAMLVNNIIEIGIHDIVIFIHKDSIEKIKMILGKYLASYSIEICPIYTTNDSILIPTGKEYNVNYITYSNTPLEVLNCITNRNEINRALRNIDMLIVSGGGFLNQIWYTEHRKTRLFSIISVMLLAETAGKKIVFLGNTIGPFGTSKDFYQIIFSRLKTAVIALRDSILSPSELRSIGVINNKIMQLIDDLYFIREELLYGNNIQTRLAKILDGYTGYIILENYLPISKIESMIDEYCLFSDRMREKYNLKVIFCALDNDFGGMNQGIIITNYAKDIELWNDPNESLLPIEELVSLIKGARIVVCQRYHMAVISLANNIPFIQVLKDVCGDKRYYYTKTMGTIEKILHGLTFDEAIFFQMDFSNAMLKISEDLENIYIIQKTLFGEIKKENEIKELANRKAFIETEILGGLNLEKK